METESPSHLHEVFPPLLPQPATEGLPASPGSVLKGFVNH